MGTISHGYGKIIFMGKTDPIFRNHCCPNRFLRLNKPCLKLIKLMHNVSKN
jgi:hypothetical protein